MTVAAIGVAYHADWIRQCREIVNRNHHESRIRAHRWSSRCHSQWMLRLMGEPGFSLVTVIVDDRAQITSKDEELEGTA
jgi:hypothetical protein